MSLDADSDLSGQSSSEVPNASYSGPSYSNGNNSGVGNSWKRNALIGAFVFAFLGGAINYFVSPSSESDVDYYSSSDEYYDYYEAYDSYSFTSDDYSLDYSEAYGYLTFVDYQYGFKLDFPEDWDLFPAYDVTLFSSQYEDYEDYLLENVAIAVEDVSYYEQITLQDYADASLGYLVNDPEYSYIGQGEATLGAYEGMYINGVYEFSDGSIVGYVTFFTIQEGAAYVLGYMYEYPEKALYFDLIDHMVDSFELVEPIEANVSADDFSDFSMIPAEEFGFTSLLHLGN